MASDPLSTLLNVGQIGIGAASGNPVGWMAAAQGLANLMGSQNLPVNPAGSVQSNYQPRTGVQAGGGKGSLSPITTASYESALQRRLDANSRRGDGTNASDYLKEGIAALNETNLDPQTRADVYRKLQAGLARA